MLESQCRQLWELKTPEEPSHGGGKGGVVSRLLWVLIPGALPGSYIEYRWFFSDIVSREIESLRNNQKEILEIQRSKTL